MNIFNLSNDPIECAKWHNDRHLVKMITESAQMLSTAHRVLDGEMVVLPMKTKTGKTVNRKILQFSQDDARCGVLYKATHANHPCSVWARTSTANYFWLYHLWVSLIDQWRKRFGHNKVHKSESLKELLKQLPSGMPVGNLTPFALAMPDEYKISDDPVLCYRQYYKLGKAHLAKWRNTDAPPWFY